MSTEVLTQLRVQRTSLGKLDQKLWGLKREREHPKPGLWRRALTCAHVDSQSYDHGSCHHSTPGLYLWPLHAVEDGHTAHMALSR